MDFKLKVEKQFQELVIDHPDAPKYIEHHYADYIELIALLRKEETTSADIYDKLHDIRDPFICETKVDEGIQNEIASFEAEINDANESKLLNIYRICEERSRIFDEDEYPFIVNTRIIKPRQDFTEKQKVYIFLLISSSLKFFKVVNSELTTDFEIISNSSLKSFLPERSIVKSFGKTSEYKGNTKAKITALAEDLGLRILDDELDCISENNVQERGLDLIGWIPFKDNIPNTLIFLCQCACGRNWDLKQGETKIFKGYFIFYKKEPINIMFVPYSLSSTVKRFYQSDRIMDDTMLFDRKRILEYFNDTDLMIRLRSNLIVSRCIEERIDV